MFLLNNNDLDEIINRQRGEYYACFNRTNNEVEVFEASFSQKNLALKEDIIFFPTDEELYPYKEAVGDFLAENDIEVPRRRKVRPYLRECGYLYDFDEFRDREVKRRLLIWMDENDIQLETV